MRLLPDVYSVWDVYIDFREYSGSKLEHFVFHFLKMSSSESRNPGPQTVQPLFGCVGTEPEYFRLPLKMEPAMFLPHSREQILEAMASSLSNPGWLDGFPSTHRVPHKRQWCVTANHRS